MAATFEGPRTGIRRLGNAVRLATWLALLAAGQHPATAQLLGPEFLVNNNTGGEQLFPRLAADGTGRVVVVWNSRAADHSTRYGLGQRFEPAGTKVGPEFLVNPGLPLDNRNPVAAMDGSDAFLVIWSDFGPNDPDGGVIGQRFGWAGGAIGSEFLVNTYTTDSQYNPAIVADGTGNFVVVWSSRGQDGSNTGVFGQRLAATGARLGPEFQVNSYTTDFQTGAVVAASGAGDFVVAWESGYFETRHIFAQRFDPAGAKVGSEFAVSSSTTTYQAAPALAADLAGNFVVVWNDLQYPGPPESKIVGRRFDATGVALGGEFRADSIGPYPGNPAVAANATGDFVVAWRAHAPGSAGYPGVAAQVFDAAGTRIGSELRVNANTAGAIGFYPKPAVVANAPGTFVVAWDANNPNGDDDGVFGRQLTVAFFTDGFEPGDACAWSAAVGGGCP